MCAHELTSSETNPIRKMDFLVLTETEFFRQIDNEAEGRELKTAYNKFINEVLVFYASASSDGRRLFSTLVYTEIELYCLHEKLSPLHDDRAYHSRKALSFVRRILKHVSTQVPPLSTPQTDSQPTSSFRWTGSLVELVEIIYAFDEIGCINDGQNDIKDLAAFFGSLFGMEIKVRNCYDAYLDMKRRKNESRTYFLDKLRERLNLRMQRDDAREMTRR